MNGMDILRQAQMRQKIFTLTSGSLTLLKRITKSPPRAIEWAQDNRGKAVKLIAVDKKTIFPESPCVENCELEKRRPTRQYHG